MKENMNSNFVTLKKGILQLSMEMKNLETTLPGKAFPAKENFEDSKKLI